jgi:hypothetical protein
MKLQFCDLKWMSKPDMKYGRIAQGILENTLTRERVLYTAS